MPLRKQQKLVRQGREVLVVPPYLCARKAIRLIASDNGEDSALLIAGSSRAGDPFIALKGD